MKIILSPAKKMKEVDDSLDYIDLPVFQKDTECIMNWMKKLTYQEAKKLWTCSDKIAEQNYDRLASMDLTRSLTPAILSYEGIAYQYMAPAVFERKQLTYVQEHLRILSGFYGVLKPMDGVIPYRLEMQAKAKVNGTKNLYEYWGDRLYKEVHDHSGIIINLASKEYSKCIEKYLQPEDTFITCSFVEEVKGKMVQKGVYCKMARGEMVRFMAVNHIEDPEEMKKFQGLGYKFEEGLSSDKEFVFLKDKEQGWENEL